MLRFPVIAAALLATTVAGCHKKEAHDLPARPVRTVTVEHAAPGETVSLTGQIRAKDEVSLAFRIDGRVLERLVNVGDAVEPGQLVARLDQKDQQNSRLSASAGLASAVAALTQARLTYGRQQELLKGGWTPRAKFDDAQQAFLMAQAQVDAAQAQLRLTQDQLSYTTLFADAAGTVTSTSVEPGEVVRAGQTIVQLARKGGRDAVFDVPERLMRTGPRDPVVQVALSNDPSIRAIGRVREVAPQADSTTRTWQVKVGIIDPPAVMALGATVTGSIMVAAPPGVDIPSSAMTEANGQPAVWVFDPRAQTVSLRQVGVARYEAAEVVISRGLEAGDVVVTAGVQALRPGQKVHLLGAAS
ncbi:MAG: efflux RND transporter periplasmic adaptor subunit [Chloroflexi bacterium]|nr:efflux RND transporter periplasmic adaptor subunit [Chloroflexota bacterium]